MVIIIMIMKINIIITLIANESQVYRRVGTLPVTDGPTPPPATNFAQPTYPTKKIIWPNLDIQLKLVLPNQFIQQQQIVLPDQHIKMILPY